MDTDEAWESFIGIRKSSAKGYVDTIAAALNNIETNTSNLTKLTNRLLGDQAMLDNAPQDAPQSVTEDVAGAVPSTGGDNMAGENQDKNALDEALGIIDEQVAGAAPAGGEGAVPPEPAEGGPEEGAEPAPEAPAEGMGVAPDDALPQPEANFNTKCIQFSEEAKKELQSVAGAGDYYKARRLIELITTIDKIIDSDGDPSTVLKSASMKKSEDGSEEDFDENQIEVINTNPPYRGRPGGGYFHDDYNFKTIEGKKHDDATLGALRTPRMKAELAGGERLPDKDQSESYYAEWEHPVENTPKGRDKKALDAKLPTPWGKDSYARQSSTSDESLYEELDEDRGDSLGYEADGYDVRNDIEPTRKSASESVDEVAVDETIEKSEDKEEVARIDESIGKSEDGQTAEPMPTGKTCSSEGERKSIPMPDVDMEKADGVTEASEPTADKGMAGSVPGDNVASSCGVKKSMPAMPSIKDLMAHRQGGAEDPYMAFAKSTIEEMQAEMDSDERFQKSVSEKAVPFSELMAKYRKG